MGTATLAALLMANLPVLAVLAWVIFGSWKRFWEDFEAGSSRDKGGSWLLKTTYFFICAAVLLVLEWRLLTNLLAR